ncbi:MAG: ABC transporter ATP-binding protein [Truepera sp.]|nr:ABC transporter ATP-binding protein [Truepera sp.]
MALVEARNLKAYYITEAYGVKRTVKAVEDISLSINEGEIYGIAGESGCGKTTLLKVLLGAFQPPLTITGGTVNYHFDGESVDVLQLTERDLRNIRWNKVSYIPQGSMHVLNPVRRINDTFYDFIVTHRPMSKREATELVRSYLNDFGLPDTVLTSFPHQLSGGMRQRVTIALATILWPKLVFADEPTTALDVVVQRGVIELLKEVQQKESSTLVLITHDMGVHAHLADRIAVLYAGNLVEEGDSQTIFKNPSHPYTQYLIQSLPTMEEKVQREGIPGRPPALDNPPSGCRFHPRCPHAMDICRETPPPMMDLGNGHRAACYLISEQESHGNAV